MIRVEFPDAAGGGRGFALRCHVLSSLDKILLANSMFVGVHSHCERDSWFAFPTMTQKRPVLATSFPTFRVRQQYLDNYGFCQLANGTASAPSSSYLMYGTVRLTS